ncbi:MAG: DNA/RNA nuclease SfsA [Ruminococcus sp.]|nr:DNA/RNA nuclease SfsA [Ruminococcus sp.]
MRYKNIQTATFISRPNRFIANVKINGNIETVHVKNTGRCKELLLPGSKVILEKSDNPTRKTKYDLIAVYKDSLGLVNIDSQAPNKIVKEWLDSKPELFSDITYLKPEFTYGKSRVDFYLECGERKIFIEVKGCTLEIDGMGYFPDAPTERGVKHMNELAKASEQGYECYIAFAITMPKIKKVLPNIETHAKFGEAMENAVKHGVKILYLPCEVKEDSLKITDCIINGNHD